MTYYRSVTPAKPHGLKAAYARETTKMMLEKKKRALRSLMCEIARLEEQLERNANAAERYRNSNHGT